MRVIADTNWYISLLIKKNESRLYLILLNDSIDIIASDNLVNELVGKVQESEFRKYFSVDYALEFISFLKERVEICSCISEVNICRDVKDNYLLALSKDANADFLITGDNDLLSIKKFHNTVICTLPDFISNFEK